MSFFTFQKWETNTSTVISKVAQSPPFKMNDFQHHVFKMSDSERPYFYRLSFSHQMHQIQVQKLNWDICMHR